MDKVKDKIKKNIKDKPHIALTVPLMLCFISFITNFIAALKDGILDSTELHQLMLSADGFETVILFIIMVALKNKKK